MLKSCCSVYRYISSKSIGLHEACCCHCLHRAYRCRGGKPSPGSKAVAWRTVCTDRAVIRSDQWILCDIEQSGSRHKHLQHDCVELWWSWRVR